MTLNELYKKLARFAKAYDNQPPYALQVYRFARSLLSGKDLKNFNNAIKGAIWEKADKFYKKQGK